MDERGLAETHRRQPWNWAVRVSRVRGTGTNRNSLLRENMNKKKKKKQRGKMDKEWRGWPLERSSGARGMILWTFVAVLQCTVKGIHSILRFSTHWGGGPSHCQSISGRWWSSHWGGWRWVGSPNADERDSIGGGWSI
ncbi:hypothetical protein BJX96DRAFT_139428 [Aspergillus floccosus]